jgi:hypothetical protein
MRLIRTDHEVIIEAPAAELTEIGRRISSLGKHETLTIEAQHQASSDVKLVVLPTDRPFLAEWAEHTGLVVQGNHASLQAFAEQFHFQCEPFPGLHNHWDLAGVLDIVDPESLPIVVQQA